jgi:hypothetical protein
MRDLGSLNFFLDVRILQKSDTIWLIQNFYINKLIKDYVINIKYKATTFLLSQSLMSYIDDVNQKRVHIYRQKMKSICFLVIIIRSNIIKIAFESTRHLTNSDSKHLKAANHCIKYLHVIKFLVIRYSNSKSEKLNNQISSSNKEKSNKEMSSTSNSKLNRKTSSNKENNDKQIFETTVDAFFVLIEKTLKSISSNCLIIWSIEFTRRNNVGWCGFSIWKLTPSWVGFLWWVAVWCGFYCGFLMSSHQNHAKKDTCFAYSFARNKRYIEEKLMLLNMFSILLWSCFWLCFWLCFWSCF